MKFLLFHSKLLSKNQFQLIITVKFYLKQVKILNYKPVRQKIQTHLKEYMYQVITLSFPMVPNKQGKILSQIFFLKCLLYISVYKNVILGKNWDRGIVHVSEYTFWIYILNSSCTFKININTHIGFLSIDKYGTSQNSCFTSWKWPWTYVYEKAENLSNRLAAELKLYKKYETSLGNRPPFMINKFIWWTKKK